jgi:hypothetical protein
MSRLVRFYRVESGNSEGRTLEDIWSWDDDSLEEVHDFIQWLFPLPEASAFNPDAPLLTTDDIAAFRGDPLLRQRLRRSLDRFLTFLGLAWDGKRVIDGPNLPAREPDCWSYPNHNWLRISRVLRSLSLLGLGDEARAFYVWLKSAHDSGRYPISDDTFRYWTNAVPPGRAEPASGSDTTMSQHFANHAILGELRWSGSSSERVLAGSALLTPKHSISVYIHIPDESDEEGVARAIDDASELFASVRRSDWDYRLALARELLGDLAGYVSEDIPLDPEGMAQQFSLTDINFNASDGTARLAYVDLTAKNVTPWHMDVNINRADSAFSIDLYPLG